MEALREELTEVSYMREMELNFSHCDRNQRMRMGSVITAAAVCAGFDYDARGLTYRVLQDLHQAFLLSRIAVRVHDCPCDTDKLAVTTWEDGARGAHLQRQYEFRRNGALCISVRSDWILVDPTTRRILRPREFTARKVTRCPVEIDCPAPKKIALPEEAEDLGTRVVRWSDLDGNGHLFSGNYGDIVWDYLPPDLRERTPREFYLNFSREATLDEELTLRGHREGEDYRMEALGPNGVCFTALCRF